MNKVTFPIPLITKLHGLSPFTIRGSKCAKQNPVLPYGLVFDWIQISVSFVIAPENIMRRALVDGEGMFRIVESKRRSLCYKYCYEVETHYFGQWEHYASIDYVPHLTCMPQDNAQIKIDNRHLYHNEYYNLIKVMMSEFGCRFKHYSRLDYAVDFQRFQNVKMRPDMLIKYLGAGRVSVRNFRKVKKTALSRNPLYLTETSTVQKKKFNQLQLGTYKSSVCIKMYNKTLEMRQKPTKPYIYEHWRTLGFDITKDTWRLEFSVKKGDLAFYFDNQDHEFFGDFSRFDFIAPNRFNQVVNTLLDNRLQLAYTKGQKQFCRMERFTLFDIDVKPLVLAHYRPTKNTSNMDRYFIKKMIDEYVKYQKKSPVTASHLKFSILEKVKEHDLDSWLVDYCISKFNNQYYLMPNDDYFYVRSFNPEAFAKSESAMLSANKFVLSHPETYNYFDFNNLNNDGTPRE